MKQVNKRYKIINVAALLLIWNSKKLEEMLLKFTKPCSGGLSDICEYSGAESLYMWDGNMFSQLL